MAAAGYKFWGDGLPRFREAAAAENVARRFADRAAGLPPSDTNNRFGHALASRLEPVL